MKKQNMEDEHYRDNMRRETSRKLERYKMEIENYYGYCADPDQPNWKNVGDYYKELSYCN